MTENTEKLLRDLANKFGTTTEKLYAVLTKQAKVRIINNILSIVLYGILAFVVIPIIKTHIHWLEPQLVKTQYSVEKVWSDENYVFIIGWVAMVILATACLVSIWNAIENIISDKINPEYKAIQEILQTIQPND